MPGAVSTGGVLSIGAPTMGNVGPGMPRDPTNANKPYIDYVLTVTAPGTYQIDLVSANTTAYDPLLRLMQGPTEVARDDDGGGYPNSRIQRALQPGTYTVRVTSFRENIPAPAPFTLTVTQTG
jgi:hypothetical protein